MANYSDNFNRASLGTDWTAINGGTWSIASSTYLQQTQSTGTYRGLRYNNVLASDNVDVSVRCHSSNTTAGVGLIVRAPNSGTAQTDLDGYAIVFFPGDTFYFLRFDNGNDGGRGYGFTYGAPAVNTYYTLRITVQGSTVTGYVDGTQRFQFTDTTYSGSGNRSVALLSYGETTRHDDFSAQDIVSSQTVTPSLFTNTNTFYTYTISNANGAQSVSLDLLENTNFFYDSTLSVVQSVSLNTANKNRYSLRFNGNGADVNRVRIPLENGSIQYPVNVGADSFTVETWIKAQYSENTTTSLDEDARYSNIFYDRDSWGEQRGHVVGVTRSGANLVVTFGQAGSGGTWTSISTTSDIGDNEWHHVAVVRNIANGNVRIFIDGIQEASGTYDTTNWSFPVGHTVGSGQDNQNLILGCEKHDVGYYFTGELDELRISNSVKYASTFQPARYLTVDGDTVALFNFDEGSGTSTVDVAESQIGTLLVGGSPSGPTWSSVEISTGVVYAASFYTQNTISPSFFNNNNAFPTPTVNPGAVSVVAERLNNNNAFYNLSISASGVNVTTNLLQSTNVFYSPTFSVGSVNVNLTKKESEATLFSHQFLVSGNNIVPNLIESGVQIPQPSFLVGGVNINLTRLESGQSFYAFGINQNVVASRIENTNGFPAIAFSTGAVSLQPNRVESTAQVFQPTVLSENSISVNLLTNSQNFFTHTFVPGAFSIVPNHISSTLQVFVPSFGSGKNVFVDYLIATNQIYQPAFNVSIVNINPNLLTSQTQTYDIFISSSNQFVLDLLQNENSFYLPKLNQNILTVLLENNTIINDITFTTQNVINAQRIENQNSFFDIQSNVGAVSITPNVIESTQIYSFGIFIGDDRDIVLDLIQNQNNFFASTLIKISEERIIRTSVQNRIIIVQ